MTFIFVLDIALQPRHGLSELPQVALDVLRANWITALSAALLAWAYDVISPKIFSRLAVLREGVREVALLQAELVELQRAQVASLADIRRAQSEAATQAKREFDAADLKYTEVVNALKYLAEQVDAHDLDKYIEGFNARQNRLHQPPDPTPPPDRGRGVVSSVAPFRRSS